MVSNAGGNWVGALAAETGALGHLYSPGAQRGPFPFLPYALDNGVFSAWQKNVDFPEDRWRRLLEWPDRFSQKPLWALVPDSVADRDRTLEKWERFSPVVRAAGFRPAFAVQDGMTFADVPDSDCMLFLGGTTGWKVAAIPTWCATFPGRVHVGRVNHFDRLLACYEAGAVSVDGNGWFRTKNKGTAEPQREALMRFLVMQATDKRKAA
jgi:hypothetical protein